jgi:hypothetical protein
MSNRFGGHNTFPIHKIECGIVVSALAGDDIHWDHKTKFYPARQRQSLNPSALAPMQECIRRHVILLKQVVPIGLGYFAHFVGA